MIARLNDASVHAQLLNSGPVRQAVVRRGDVTIASSVWAIGEGEAVRDLARILGVSL